MHHKSKFGVAAECMPFSKQHCMNVHEKFNLTTWYSIWRGLREWVGKEKATEYIKLGWLPLMLVKLDFSSAHALCLCVRWKIIILKAYKHFLCFIKKISNAETWARLLTLKYEKVRQFYERRKGCEYESHIGGT